MSIKLLGLDPEDVMDNLKRRYGAISPPVDYNSCMVDDEEQEQWLRKGLEQYYIWSLQDLCSEFGYDNVEATEELAWIYFLILKRQEGHINAYERRALKVLIIDFLEYIEAALYQWLVVHGVIKDKETFETVIMNAYYHDPETWWSLISEKREELEDEGYNAYDWTDTEIVEEIIKDMWKERTEDDSFSWLAPGFGKPYIGDIIAKAQALIKKIQTYKRTPEIFPLKDLIIVLDSAVDFEHQNGKLLEDIYFYIDVILSKKLAELKFEEVYGGTEE